MTRPGRPRSVRSVWRFPRAREDDEIAASTPQSCRLKATTGEHEECPRGWCPFWDRESEQRVGACALERLQIDFDNGALTGYLLELRATLEDARDRDRAAEALESLRRLAPPGLNES